MSLACCVLHLRAHLAALPTNPSVRVTLSLIKERFRGRVFWYAARSHCTRMVHAQASAVSRYSTHLEPNVIVRLASSQAYVWSWKLNTKTEWRRNSTMLPRKKYLDTKYCKSKKCWMKHAYDGNFLRKMREMAFRSSSSELWSWNVCRG